jgi:lipoyl(octanoyl) transferase
VFLSALTYIKGMEWITESGLVDYPEAVKGMENHVTAMISGQAGERVWFLEHPPLYTAGTSAKAADLIDSRFPVYDTGRGGQYTYHGPGQLVCYAMMNLNNRYPVPDLRRYVQELESWIIGALADFGITGERRDGRIGIWVVDEQGVEAKIGAIGIRVRRGVSYHGFSLNINPDLTHFSGIVPCGVHDFGVTSLHKLGVKAQRNDVERALTINFDKIFGQN